MTTELSGREVDRRPSYRARHSAHDSGASAPRSRPNLVAAPSVAALPDRDLVLNRAGQSARAQAGQERGAAPPVRTRVARALRVRAGEHGRAGAVGEEWMGQLLSRLPSGWGVLHSIPLGDSDIDHLMIGPGGVFTISAKHHPRAAVWVRGDMLKIDGAAQPYVYDSRHQAARAAKLLSVAARFDVEVRGIVTMLGASRRCTVIEQPLDGRVIVTAGSGLVAYLDALPPVLGAPSITRIFTVARHLATWQPSTVRWQDFDAD